MYLQGFEGQRTKDFLEKIKNNLMKLLKMGWKVDNSFNNKSALIYVIQLKELTLL